MMSEYFPEIVDGFHRDIEDKLDLIEVENLNWKSIVRDPYGGFKKTDHADANIEKVELEERLSDETCESCGRLMAYKHGAAFREFLACTGYPDCKNTRMIIHGIGVSLPRMRQGNRPAQEPKRQDFLWMQRLPCLQPDLLEQTDPAEVPQMRRPARRKKIKDADLVCSDNECGYKEKLEV